MMSNNKRSAAIPGKFMSTVKMGSKGQIVIPKEARELIGACPGDTLLLLADSARGVAIHKYDVWATILENALDQAHAPHAPNEEE